MAKKSNQVTSWSVNKYDADINSPEHTPAVLFYTAKPCIWCEATRDFLKLEKIHFKEIDVSKEGEVRQEMVKKSGQERIPVLDIDGKIIIGYNPEEIRKALKKDNRPLKGFFHLFAKRAKANHLEETEKAFSKSEKKEPVIKSLFKKAPLPIKKRSAKQSSAIKKESFPRPKAQIKVEEKAAHKPKPIFFKKHLPSKPPVIPLIAKKREKKIRARKKSFYWLILLGIIFLFIILSLAYLFIYGKLNIIYDRLDIFGTLFERLSSIFNLYLSKVKLLVDLYLNTEIKFYAALGVLSLFAALIAFFLFRSIRLNRLKKRGITAKAAKKKFIFLAKGKQKEVNLPVKKKLSLFGWLFKKKQEVKPLASAKIEISKNETEIDSLYHLIQEKGKVNLQEVIHKFGVSKELAEEWAQILESHELIAINYPLFNPPVLSLSLPKAVESQASKPALKEAVKEPTLLKTEKFKEAVKEEAKEKTKEVITVAKKPGIAPKTRFHQQITFHRADIKPKIKSKIKSKLPVVSMIKRIHQHQQALYHRPLSPPKNRPEAGKAGVRKKISRFKRIFSSKKSSSHQKATKSHIAAKSHVIVLAHHLKNLHLKKKIRENKVDKKQNR